MEKFGGILWLVFDIAVSMVGYTIHHSIFWSIVDFIFSPVAVVWWLLTHQLTLTVLKTTFAWFFV